MERYGISGTIVGDKFRVAHNYTLYPTRESGSARNAVSSLSGSLWTNRSTNPIWCGAIENTKLDIARSSKMQGWTTRDLFGSYCNLPCTPFTELCMFSRHPAWNARLALWHEAFLAAVAWDCLIYNRCGLSRRWRCRCCRLTLGALTFLLLLLLLSSLGYRASVIR